MLINQIIPLTEKVVDSSWIADVTYKRNKRDPEEKRDRSPKFSDVTITTRDGRKYTVKRVPYMLYVNWQKSPSKGQFWHQHIKDKYEVA